MTVLMFVLGVLLFTVGLALSVGLHELGHLIPGKLFGVKVTQYFVGFGPTLWSRRRGETEYGVKAVPLGGYVKLVGMLPPGDRSKVPSSRSRGIFSQLVDDARHAESDETEGVPPDRLFYRLPWWKKVIVMVSGVMTNIVLAFLLFAVVFMGHGINVATTTVAGVSRCVVVVTSSATQSARACGPGDPASPARKAGFRVGDKVLSFNGTRIHDWPQLRSMIGHNGDRTATVVVRRDGHRVTLTAATTVSPRVDPGNPQRVTRKGFLGIGPGQVRERQSPAFVASTMVSGTWETLHGIVTLPPKLYHVGRAALGLEARDQNGPMSVVGAGRVAGEMTSQHSVPLSDRFFSVLLLLAGLNLFLGMLNLVPLLPLDGGQIAGALYEGLRRGWAKVRHRPDPGFVDIAKLLPIGYVMAGVILVASAVLIYADIVAPVTLT